MTHTDLRTTPLTASWNSGGTYESAFEVLGHGSTATSIESEHTFLGEIERVHKGKTGYTLTLTHRHPDRAELRIWLQQAIQSKLPAGPKFWQELTSGGIKPAMFIFALGKFEKQMPSAGNYGHFYSLPVTDARRVWVVAATAAHALMPPEP